jgi:hypothetical protein
LKTERPPTFRFLFLFSFILKAEIKKERIGEKEKEKGVKKTKMKEAGYSVCNERNNQPSGKRKEKRDVWGSVAPQNLPRSALT